MPKKKTNEKFSQELYDLHGDEYQLVGDYFNMETKVEIKHKTCELNFIVRPTTMLSEKKKQNHCPYCNGRKAMKGVTDIATTNKHLFSLLNNPEDGYKYMEHSNCRTDFRCPNCGEIIKDKCINDVNTYGLSCPKCGDGVSYPSKIVYSVLSQLGVDFITEKTFDWCRYEFKGEIKKGYYDFYFIFNEHEYIIEVDGGFHSQTNRMNGRTREESEYIDTQKENLAHLHGIEDVIRVDCVESNIQYIKDSITNSNMRLIFDLSSIDWDECHKYGLSSEIINACNLYKQNYSVVEVAKMLHKNRTTIVRYLKNGAKVGCCDYDSKDALRKSADYSRQFLKKPVICLQTKKVYESEALASRECNASGIIRSCRNRRLYSGVLEDGTPLFWMYYDKYLKYKNDHDNEEPPSYDKYTNDISVVQYNLQYVFMAIFKSIKEASQKTLTYNTSITNNCKGKQKTAGGYIWRYATAEEIQLHKEGENN